MIELEIALTGQDKIDAIGRKLHTVTLRKLTQLTDIMYNKVQENLSGKILQKQTGQLASSIRKEVTESGSEMMGVVFVDPVTPKALALEKGGERYYDIYPVRAKMLRFVNKSGEIVYASHTYHPPSKDFAYLRTALEEMESLIPESFRESIETLIRDGA